MAGRLQGQCGRMFDPEALASFAAWGLLEFLETVHKPMVQELMHSPFVQSAKEKAIHAVKQKTHDGLDQFCGQPDCIAGLSSFDKEYGACYAGTLCASLHNQLDFDKCKNAMQEFLPKMFRNTQSSLCAHDGGYYCSEEDTDLLLQNPECFVQFKMPVAAQRDCSKQCVDLWKKAEREHPSCMKVLERQTKESYEIERQLIQLLASASKDPVDPHLPPSFATFPEVCLDGKKRFVV